VEFRSKARVFDDLTRKLESLPPGHPDRPRLTRMILDLRHELERTAPPQPLAADD
jgi:hypothetical protein